MGIKVVIADDHPLILQSLRSALDASEDFDVVGQTDSGTHVLPLVGRTAPQLVLMDVQMPGMDGLTCLDLLRQRHPEIKVVLISASGDQAQIQGALRRGAAGYILKSIDPVELPTALKHALNGTAYYPVGGTETADEHVSRTAGLTDREITILKALARGLSNKQLSQELWVTEQTVKFHLSNVYRKLNVSNRAEAVGYAHRHGIASSDAQHP